MPFSHLRGGLEPPHCSGGFIPPARFSSAGASCASRMGLRDAVCASRTGLRDELHRSPVTGPPASRTVCADNAPPASSLQLRFRESGGPAVPPSRHAGRCCCTPGSRTNHRELHRSPEIGLPASSLQLPASRTSKSFRMHSYEKRACKSFGIHSYKIIELKVSWNEHLQKKVGGGGQRDQKARLLSCPKCVRPSTPCFLGRPEAEASGIFPPHSHFSIWEGPRYKSRTP